MLASALTMFNGVADAGLPGGNRLRQTGARPPMWRILMLRVMMVTGVIGVTLAGCATPETRVRTGLIEAGLSRPLATCMADRMVDRLSLLQLRRIGRLGSLSDRPANGLTTDQFLHRARALGDPEIWGVLSSSAAICAVRR
jgi:hypothetical protein